MYLILKIIALPFPWLVMLILGRPMIGLIYLVAQVTLIGWFPASIGAIYIINQLEKEQRAKKSEVS